MSFVLTNERRGGARRTLTLATTSLRLPDKIAMVFDRHWTPELLLRDAGRRLHLWDVDLVFNADRLMYLASMVVAI